MAKSLFYKHKPIGSISSLCRALRIPGISPRQLVHLAETADDYFRVAKEIPKANGVRVVHDVREPLKTVQKAIHSQIFGAAIFPSYLSGGIKGRSTKSHARPHVGAEILINEDISNFFPSITQEQVKDLFIYGFGFAPRVGLLLSKLLTLRGAVPQGASTSGDIANLVMFRTEPKLVQELEVRGFAYNRFIDDMSISTQRQNVDKKQLSAVISKVVSNARSHGLKINRKKHSIARKGAQMTTVGHLVNRKVSIARRYEGAAHIAVKKAEVLAEDTPDGVEAQKALISAKGKVAHLSRMRPRRAAPLDRRIKALKDLMA